MIISNSKKFIFVHITKAAGTSIKKCLNDTLNWNDLIIGGTRFGETIQNFYNKKFNLHKHSRAIDIKKVIGEDLWNDYFTFTFVRNPYSRAVSLYTYIKKSVYSRGIKRHLRFFPIKRIQSDQFWNWPATKAFLETNNFSEFIRHGKLNLALGSRPQNKWIMDENKNIIVDFIGKIESIDEDFKIISEKLQMDLSELGMHNRSSNKRWDTYLRDEKDYEYLYKIYKKDFEILGYDPDPLDRKIIQ